MDIVILKVGQAISPGMPLCNILNLSKLKVQGEVTEAYASKVRQTGVDEHDGHGVGNTLGVGNDLRVGVRRGGTHVHSTESNGAR